MTWEEFVAANLPAPATCSVQPLTGSAAYGLTYADSVDVVPCIVEDTRRQVTVQTVDAAGQITLSSTTVYAPLTPEIVPGSLVTTPGRDARRVLAVERLTAAGLPLPEHQQLALE